MGRLRYAGGKQNMVAPVGGILLNNIAEGSIVKLNENGSPVEFYVAKHNYESALNGAGRVLLIRKNCYDIRVWSNGNYLNQYNSSGIDIWLNGIYKNLFDANIISHINTTKIYYTPYGDTDGTQSITTIEKAIFLASAYELYGPTSAINTEGSILPISNMLKVAYYNGSPVAQWTRSPHRYIQYYVAYLTTSGSADYNGGSFTAGSRPCFTLPATAMFDAKTLEFKGVA